MFGWGGLGVGGIRGLFWLRLRLTFCLGFGVLFCFEISFEVQRYHPSARRRGGAAGVKGGTRQGCGREFHAVAAQVTVLVVVVVVVIVVVVVAELVIVMVTFMFA